MYQYKIVLVCAGAHWFRNSNWDYTLEQLQSVNLTTTKSSYTYSYVSRNFKNQDELDYAFKLLSFLSISDDIDIRVESPWVTVYTNTQSNIDKLINLDANKVKYVCTPPDNVSLSENTIIMPKIDFEFKVTLSKIVGEQHAFIEWAQSNSKLKLTKSCINALKKPRSWGGTHFYITGEKNLLLARMHLGSSIGKIERIVKA